MSIYEMVTQKILTQLESGDIPWRKPWIAIGGACNYETGKPYSLLNQILLEKPGYWLTFNQIKNNGGSIRKGEKSSVVVFYKVVEKEVEGKEEKEKYPCLRYYHVWHISQCDGIKEKQTLNYELTEDRPAEEVVQSYITREGIKFENQMASNKAYYSISDDKIVVPMLSQYSKVEDYYSTLFHEMVHSTGAESRLNRLIKKSVAFGGEDYSKEELVAEIGSSMLSNMFGLSLKSTMDNNVAYIKSWLKALKNDNKMIVFASSQAEKAVKFILNVDSDV